MSPLLVGGLLTPTQVDRGSPMPWHWRQYGDLRSCLGGAGPPALHSGVRYIAEMLRTPPGTVRQDRCA